MLQPPLNGAKNLKEEEKSMCSNPTSPKNHPKIIQCAQTSGHPVPESKYPHIQCVAPCIPMVVSIHVRLRLILYQNLAICFLSFLSCFNPLISILFAYPVATAYPVPDPVPVPTGKPLLAETG